MTRSAPAAPRRRPPPADPGKTRRERLAAWAAARWSWFTDNAMILTIIGINGSASYEHMAELARVNGQTGLDIYLVSGIFDLFAAALEAEKRKDRKRGTASVAPVILQQLSILFSVLANYATKGVLSPKVTKAMEAATGIHSSPFWQVTFSVAPPIVLMLAILMMERRYRLDEKKKPASGTEAGTGDGNRRQASGNPDGTASGNPDGTGAPEATGTGGAGGGHPRNPAPPPARDRDAGAWWPAGVDFPRMALAGQEDDLYRRQADAVLAAMASYAALHGGRRLPGEVLRIHLGIRKSAALRLLAAAEALGANRAVPPGSRGPDWSEWEGVSA
jgi:hypothetical protein